jgi:hypothetical protein
MKRPFAHFTFLQGSVFVFARILAAGFFLSTTGNPPPFPVDTNQVVKRTCFRIGKASNSQGNLRSDTRNLRGVEECQLNWPIGDWPIEGNAFVAAIFQSVIGKSPNHFSMPKFGEVVSDTLHLN